MVNEDIHDIQFHIEVAFTEDDFVVLPVDASRLNHHEQLFYKSYSNDKARFVFELAFIDSECLSDSVSYLRNISRCYVKEVVNQPSFNLSTVPSRVDLSENVSQEIIGNVPYVIGSEYVNRKWIGRIVSLLNDSYIRSCSESGEYPRVFISHKDNSIIIPSRVYFHVVENKFGDEYPFAFLATYTLSVNGKVNHAPLKNTLKESGLYQIIKPIIDVSEKSDFIKRLLDSGDIFNPIKLSDEEAYVFLCEVSLYEKYGIICRIPKWYTENNSSIIIDFDEKREYQYSYFNSRIINLIAPKMIYHGIPISIEDAREFLNKQEGLEYLKGRWVEINHQQLISLISEYESLSHDGTTLLDVLRNKSGLLDTGNQSRVTVDFSRSDYLEKLTAKILNENKVPSLPDPFVSVLRPYQVNAFKWLCTMSSLGMGVCLADDMGLGKTVEILSYLESCRENGSDKVLIVVPATLIDNWRHEIEKFVPDMSVFVLRGTNEPDGTNVNGFVTLCTYQTMVKSEYVCRIDWDIVILDEAQAIKNFYTAQTIKAKSIPAKMKIAMTGTPIENNLLELWSIFDFINPGLLGSRDEFRNLHSRLKENSSGYKDLKLLINPFIMRRLKTDKSIIADLPEKHEVDVRISLTKEQIILYKRVVEMMNELIRKSKNKQEERIIVLTSLMKLKQVCNHPSQYYGNDIYDPDLSGKFLELQRICSTIYSRNERVLVFTQFKEIIPALDSLLEVVFCKKGLCIDGGTAMKKRDEYVLKFQTGDVPYMILSLKTAGVGLNLTAAQNVIHFDRWWNPAVENQATDRAYRIGQRNDVTVYRFITAHTIEERIDTMISNKQELADTVINDLEEYSIGKLSTDELIKAASYGGLFDENV